MMQEAEDEPLFADRAAGIDIAKTGIDCRHSANSLLKKLGVPDSVRANWFGHTIQVNRST
jgi:hypothetical protein